MLLLAGSVLLVAGMLAIGIQFTRGGLAHAARCFPPILASIAALIAFSGMIAMILHRVAGTELLTAFLATSPGGVDSAIVIAASTRVDMPFVMGLETVRLIVVLFLGPSLAIRWQPVGICLLWEREPARAVLHSWNLRRGDHP